MQHLYESLGFKSFHLRWVPHQLTDDFRHKRKKHVSAMLPFLYVAQRNGWRHFVTGDESWFVFHTSPRRIWMLSRDNVVTKLRQQIQSKKFMFMIIWNPSGLYVVNRFPNDTKMNSAYFVTNMLIPIEEVIFSQGRAPHKRQFVIHLDNCSIHTSRVSTDWFEEYDIVRMQQPPYSLHLASSDFYLFLTVKEKLERIQLTDENQLFESLQAILSRLDQEESNAIFPAWVRRI
jgi:hypothetical protein